MTTTTMIETPNRSRSVLRTAMNRSMTSREREIRGYVSRTFPSFDIDPFAQGRDRRESLLEVTAPTRA